MVGWQLSFVDDGHNNKKQHDPRLIYSGIYLYISLFCIYKNIIRIMLMRVHQTHNIEIRYQFI